MDIEYFHGKGYSWRVNMLWEVYIHAPLGKGIHDNEYVMEIYKYVTLMKGDYD